MRKDVGMLQAIMTKPGKIEYRDVPVPDVRENQVKLKIKTIGVCGSDIHVYHGEHPYTGYPVVQGHEVAAEITDVGQNVTKFKVGDRVTVQPQVVCGECYQCVHGIYNDCDNLKVMGFQTTGMASEYFVVDANKLLNLPDSMSWDQGALIEPLAVAVHAVRRVENIEGKKALVLGGGPIGNLVAQTAKAMGASSVLISELSDYRLEVAKKCGINTIDTNKEDMFEKILENFGSDKADYIFECVGINTTTNQAIEYARKGSTIVAVGVFANIAQINMGYVQDHELTVKGSAMYREEDYVKAIDLVNKGLVDLDVLITHRVEFQNFIEAYELINQQKDKVMKVM